MVSRLDSLRRRFGRDASWTETSSLWLSSDDARKRFEEVFQPYHQRIRDELDARRARACPSVLVALHSFTPVYMNEGRRWHVGVLYGRDPRLGRLVREGLRSDGTLIVGDNQPYSVSDASDYTIIVHGEQRGIPHVELEIRQDLLASESDVQSWAKRLGGVLEAAVPHVCPT